MHACTNDYRNIERWKERIASEKNKDRRKLLTPEILTLTPFPSPLRTKGFEIVSLCLRNTNKINNNHPIYIIYAMPATCHKKTGKKVQNSSQKMRNCTVQYYIVGLDSILLALCCDMI